MSKTYFLSITDLKEDHAIHGNVDDSFIKSAIIRSQDIKIQSILGTQLYEEIAGQIDAATVTALNKTLLDTFINPILSYYTLAEIIIQSTFQLTNRGLANKDGTNETSVSMSDAENVERRYNNKAEWYGQRLTDYLVANESDYPLFNPTNTDCFDILPKRNNFTNSIYFADRDNCNEHP